MTEKESKAKNLIEDVFLFPQTGRLFITFQTAEVYGVYDEVYNHFKPLINTLKPLINDDLDDINFLSDILSEKGFYVKHKTTKKIPVAVVDGVTYYQNTTEGLFDNGETIQTEDNCIPIIYESDIKDFKDVREYSEYIRYAQIKKCLELYEFIGYYNEYEHSESFIVRKKGDFLDLHQKAAMKKEMLNKKEDVLKQKSNDEITNEFKQSLNDLKNLVGLVEYDITNFNPSDIIEKINELSKQVNDFKEKNNIFKVL